MTGLSLQGRDLPTVTQVGQKTGFCTEGSESRMWEYVSVSLSGSLSAPKASLWLDSAGSSWAWRRWEGGSKSPKYSGASRGAGPDSLCLSFMLGKAPGLAARGWGCPRNRGAGAERKGLLSKTRQRPTKAGRAFHLSSQTAWPFSRPGSRGADPSELGMGCC